MMIMALYLNTLVSFALKVDTTNIERIYKLRVISKDKLIKEYTMCRLSLGLVQPCSLCQSQSEIGDHCMLRIFLHLVLCQSLYLMSSLFLDVIIPLFLLCVSLFMNLNPKPIPRLHCKNGDQELNTFLHHVCNHV